MQSSHANESKWSMQTDQHKACKYIDASLLQSKENMQTDQNKSCKIHLILLYFNQYQRCKLAKTWLYKSKIMILYFISVICWFFPYVCYLHDCMICVLWLHELCFVSLCMIACILLFAFHDLMLVKLRMYTGAVLGTTPHTPHTSPTKTLNNTRTHQKTANHSITF